jgi:hypothetical protein
MPGFDGTGPAGTGPMTGWGRGFCGAYGTRGFYRGFGFRYGWGGRGGEWRHRAVFPGWGWGWFGWPPYGPAYAPVDELAVLKEEAAWLKGELDAVEQRINELESSQTDEE